MRWPGTTNGFAVYAVAAVFCLLALPAQAASIKAVPSISLEERWDSNIFNTSTNEESDFVFLAKPGLTLFVEVFQSTAKISGGFEVERYADHDELDDETATSDLGLEVTEPFRISPRLSLLPSAGYIETRDSTRRNRSTPAPSPELPSTETVVTERSKSRDYRASLRMTYLVTPRVDFSLGGGWSQRDFAGDETVSDVEDSQTVSGDANVAYRITPRFSSGVYVNAGRHRYQTSPDARSYSGGVTGSYLLTRHYSADARAGVSYLKEDADGAGQENTEWSPSGSLSLKYTWQYFQADLSGSYELSGGGSFGQTTKRGTVTMTLTNQFAERLWWDLSGSYQRNRSTDDAGLVNINTAEASAGIRYTAAQWASFRLSGNILRQRSDGQEGDDIDRESVFLGVELRTLYKLF